MDEYAVRVDRMPPGVTPAEFLRDIREDMNGFVDTSYSRFSAYPDEFGLTGNAREWVSDDPTGSFVHIQIPGDPGTVAVIDSDADHWTFATVQSPRDDAHPVSGNRQFGYDEHADGSVTFYTRGVDRITNSGMTLANRMFPGEASLDGLRSIGRDTDGAVFSGGDKLWRSFQERIKQEIEEGRGSATIVEPVAARIAWNRVDDVLLGRESVRSFFNREAGR